MVFNFIYPYCIQLFHKHEEIFTIIWKWELSWLNVLGCSLVDFFRNFIFYDYFFDDWAMIKVFVLLDQSQDNAIFLLSIDFIESLISYLTIPSVSCYSIVFTLWEIEFLWLNHKISITWIKNGALNILTWDFKLKTIVFHINIL